MFVKLQYKSFDGNGRTIWNPLEFSTIDHDVYPERRGRTGRSLGQIDQTRGSSARIIIAVEIGAATVLVKRGDLIAMLLSGEVKIYLPTTANHHEWIEFVVKADQDQEMIADRLEDYGNLQRLKITFVQKRGTYRSDYASIIRTITATN